MGDHYKEYSLAYISVDCIVFGFDNRKLKMLLGRRQINPGRGEWASMAVLSLQQKILNMLRKEF